MNSRRISNPNVSVEKIQKGNKIEYVVTRAVTIDGKRYKSEHRSTNKSLAEKYAREGLAIQVVNAHEEMEVTASSMDAEFGQPTRIAPSEMRHSEGIASGEGSIDHIVADPLEIGGSGTVRPENMEGFDPAMEDQFSFGDSGDSSGSDIDIDLVSDLEGTGDNDSTIIQETVKQPREVSTSAHVRTERQRNHVPWSETPQGPLDGRGGRRLKEPNPEYFVRPGEKWIKGQNNTGIFLGRDHAPTNQQVFSKHSSSREFTSGYSDYMTAGAIDIVAGRMAPYPLENTGIKGILLKPSFNTSFPPEVQGVQLENGQHPGMVMDAARIYISQMTNIDENFKVTTNVSAVPGNFSDPMDTRWTKRKVAPTSGIMVKADKVRLHARQDLKIVTGGPYETYNSLGNPVRQNNGIHLIAENGIDKNGNLLPQQPMVLGNNLIKLLEYQGALIEDTVQTMDAVVQTQMNFNQIISTNFDLLPIPSGTTIPNPFKQLAGVVTQLGLLLRRFDALSQLINNFKAKTTYLSDMGTNENFILSRFNTVN